MLCGNSQLGWYVDPQGTIFNMLTESPQGIKLFEQILGILLAFGKKCIYTHVSKIVVGKLLVPLAIKLLPPVFVCPEEWPTCPRNK